MDERESILTPSMFYKVQPENQGILFKCNSQMIMKLCGAFLIGKIIWLSGPPGAGKSTSGLFLAKKYGYVYYEADGYMFSVNPYIPLDSAEPSMATMSQPPLKVAQKLPSFAK